MVRYRMLMLLTFTLSACDAAPPGGTTPPASSKPAATAAPSAQASSQVAPMPTQENAIPAPPDVTAAPADAEKASSGLASKVITPGKGKDHPGPQDRVKVHYTGWTKDGRMFDSSVSRGEPASFRLDQVIKGWTEGVQLMVTGEKRCFWIPAELAYGETARRPGAPSGMLVFDVELLEFTASAKPPAVPEDVAKAPASAKKTKSGLSYRVLSKGKGTQHPKASDLVEVHYSGWTMDGHMFDSSVTRGEPATFRLDQVIKGWTEGVQLMVPGEKARFWIPGDLAYGDKPSRPGAPAGTLVFDIELLSIK